MSFIKKSVVVSLLLCSSVTHAVQLTDFQGLGDLAGGSFLSRAYGVSADGSVVVGQGTSANGEEAFRYDAVNGMVGLGDLAGGFFSSQAFGVSADGSVVVGLGSTANSTEAFIWDETSGMQSLQDALLFNGVTAVTGWQLQQARAISEDGSTIVGFGINPAGQREAFLATLAPVPVPAAVWLFGSALMGLLGFKRKI